MTNKLKRKPSVQITENAYKYRDESSLTNYNFSPSIYWIQAILDYLDEQYELSKTN